MPRETQWSLMCYVAADYNYWQQMPRLSPVFQREPPAWPCPHCQTVVTILTCTYTPNRWATEAQPAQPGDLCCPHCDTRVARAYVRLLFKWDKQGMKAAQEDEDDEGDEGYEEP